MKDKIGTFARSKDVIMGAYAPYYDLMMKVMTLGREKSLRQIELDIIGVKKGDIVLEIGCGTGTLSLSAFERTGNMGKVYGIDAAPEMIQKSRKKSDRFNKNIEFQVGDISDIPFDDNMFDVVMCSFMIFHISPEKRERGFNEICRVLKNNGAVLIVDTIKEEGIQILENSMKPLFSQVKWGFKKVGFLLPQIAYIRGITEKNN